MSFEHIVKHELKVGEGRINSSNSYTGSKRVSVDEEVADSATDEELGIKLDVSAVKSFFLMSDQDVTFETNDGTTPDDSISLVAGVPYVWNEDSYDDFLLTTDVTAAFVTNASGATARIQMEAIVDATP